MSPESAPLLRVANLVKRFGGFRALDGLSLSIAPGEVLGLVGPNGSGKTTCINVISGLYAADDGEVLLDGKSISGVKPHHLVHLGINRTFQVPKPFLSLTVRDNIKVASAYGAHSADAPDPDHLLASLDLTRIADRRANELNSAQQKMLDLARALATGPRLLLVDELAAGLNPGELEWVGGKLKELARTSMAIIVVEHLMGFIEQVTDRVIVLNAGKEIFEGKLAAAVRVPQVIEVFLGGAHAA